MDTPQVLAGCGTVAVGDFVDEFAHRSAPERLRFSPADFRITRIADFYTFEYSTRALGRVNQLRAAGEGILAEHLTPLELTQRTGEVVVLPELWGTRCGTRSGTSP